MKPEKKNKKTHPKKRIEAVLVPEPFFWGLGEVPLEADHHDFYFIYLFWMLVKSGTGGGSGTHRRGSRRSRLFHPLDR